MFCGNQKKREMYGRLQSRSNFISALSSVFVDLCNFIGALSQSPEASQRPPVNSLVYATEGHPGPLLCPCMFCTCASAGSLAPRNKWGVTCATNFLTSWPPCDPAKTERMMLPEA